MARQVSRQSKACTAAVHGTAGCLALRLPMHNVMAPQAAHAYMQRLAAREVPAPTTPTCTVDLSNGSTHCKCSSYICNRWPTHRRRRSHRQAPPRRNTAQAGTHRQAAAAENFRGQAKGAEPAAGRPHFRRSVGGTLGANDNGQTDEQYDRRPLGRPAQGRVNREGQSRVVPRAVHVAPTPQSRLPGPHRPLSNAHRQSSSTARAAPGA